MILKNLNQLFFVADFFYNRRAVLAGVCYIFFIFLLVASFHLGKAKHLFCMIINLVISLGVGLLPSIDNYAQVGGLIWYISHALVCKLI